MWPSLRRERTEARESTSQIPSGGRPWQDPPTRRYPGHRRIADAAGGSRSRPNELSRAWDSREGGGLRDTGGGGWWANRLSPSKVRRRARESAPIARESRRPTPSGLGTGRDAM